MGCANLKSEATIICQKGGITYIFQAPKDPTWYHIPNPKYEK